MNHGSDVLLEQELEADHLWMLLQSVFYDSLQLSRDPQKTSLLTMILNLTPPKYTKENKRKFVMTPKRNFPKPLTSP